MKSRLELVPKSKQQEPEVTFPDYDRIAPGDYPAYSHSARIYRDNIYHRWTCVVIFDVLNAGRVERIANVPWFLNLGKGGKPYAGMRSKFFQAFLDATGRRPVRRERITATFFKHRHATITVEDTRSDSRGIRRPNAAYSVVRKVRWNTGVRL